MEAGAELVLVELGGDHMMVVTAVGATKLGEALGVWLCWCGSGGIPIWADTDMS